MSVQIRFTKIEEDEQTRMDQKSLRQKKELLKQEFEHQEEMKKQDDKAIVSSNDFKFKAELDRLQIAKRQRQAELAALQKASVSTSSGSRSRQTTSMMHSSSYGCIRSINNHHSDPLFEAFKANLHARYPEDLEAYHAALQEQEQRYENLILEEQEKSESLAQILGEVERSKLILQQRIEQAQTLVRMEEKRFSNTETLGFLSNEKNSISKRNLKSIKSEVDQMRQMQDTYKRSQENKQSDLQKVIYVGEENIGHNVLKMEEAELKLQQLEQEIERLHMQEQRILKKKQKSRYILNYIECFEQFEQIFMNKTNPQERRLVDQYTVSQEAMKKHSFVEVRFESTNASQIEHDFDRNELLSQINQFYSKGEGRAQIILDFMLEYYWHLQAELSKSSLEYENLLKAKKNLIDELEAFGLELQELKDKNPDLEVHEQSLVAEDAGLLEVENQMTTLKIKKMELEEHSEKVLGMKATKAQGLLMKFQLGLAEFLYRIFQIISAVDNKNKDIKKFKYPGLQHEMHNFDVFYAQIYHSATKRPSHTPVDGHLDVSPQHLNLFQITKTFQEVFPGHDVESASQYFYVQCKTDQILWFHLTMENLKQFLQSLNLTRLSNFKNILGTNQINSFRDELIRVFIDNFQNLLEFYKVLYRKTRDISTDLLDHLKENNPKFDPSKLTRIITRESQDIKQAKDLIIRRMIEYKTGDTFNLRRDANMSFKPKPKTEEDTTMSTNQVQSIQPDNSTQLPILPKDSFSEEQLLQLKSFFRAKVSQKSDHSKQKVEINRVDRAKSKKQLEAKTQKSLEKDEFEQVRDAAKFKIEADNQRYREEKERKLKPESKETPNERKEQIKQATERLYGERNYTVQIVRTMAVTSNIISDINQLDQQQSTIEQPQLVSQYVMQRKNLHRNLTKDLTLPTLSYLKPTSAYFSRRNQSSEQIKALDYKRYYEIENGVGSRPQTQQIQRKPISKTVKQQFNTEELKRKYQQRPQTNEYHSKLPLPIPEFEDKPKSILVPQAP